MSKIRFNLRREQDLNKDFSPKEEERISLYMHCDGLSSWIGYVNNVEEVHALIKPEVLIDTLNNTLSQDELDVFIPLLTSCNLPYKFYDEEYRIKQDNTDDVFEYFKEQYEKASFRVVPGHWPDFESKEEVDRWISMHETLSDEIMEKLKK